MEDRWYVPTKTWKGKKELSVYYPSNSNNIQLLSKAIEGLNEYISYLRKHVIWSEGIEENQEYLVGEPKKSIAKVQNRNQETNLRESLQAIVTRIENSKNSKFKEILNRILAENRKINKNDLDQMNTVLRDMVQKHPIFENIDLFKEQAKFNEEYAKKMEIKQEKNNLIAEGTAVKADLMTKRNAIEKEKNNLIAQKNANFARMFPMVQSQSNIVQRLAAGPQNANAHNYLLGWRPN